MRLSEQLSLISEAREKAPVPVFTLARQLGLGCEPRPLGPDISGMLEKVSEGQYRLYFNKNDPETRQRFTVAHELGHFVLHRAMLGDGVDDDTAYRSTLKGKHKNMAIGPRQETQANRFAANLLMPEELIQSIRRGDPGITPEELANRLRVSKKAMEIRLSGIPPLRPVEQPSRKWRRNLREQASPNWRSPR